MDCCQLSPSSPEALVHCLLTSPSLWPCSRLALVLSSVASPDLRSRPRSSRSAIPTTAVRLRVVSCFLDMPLVRSGSSSLRPPNYSPRVNAAVPRPHINDPYSAAGSASSALSGSQCCDANYPKPVKGLSMRADLLFRNTTVNREKRQCRVTELRHLLISRDTDHCLWDRHDTQSESDLRSGEYRPEARIMKKPPKVQ
ncbi:hypothetical protein B0H16DRAFT_1705004 [Mycena metata]|uniref:Uncharacterized protein n=1 Tax=Mycena metata TaxID=1033252 RepID=A0AAD7GNN0_9AGAR|nr:hypothetical protein B0H16DRAFT_1705004 [Mycena metata]